MNKYFPLLLTFVFILSCKKKDESKKSTWFLNDEQYSDKATASIGKAIAILSNENTSAGFKLVFYLPYLPFGDYQKEWDIIGDNHDQDPTVASLFFYRNGNAYYISVHNTVTLTASGTSQKARYELEGAWFVNYTDPNDSVYVKATLIEP